MCKKPHKFNAFLISVFLIIFLCINSSCAFNIPSDSKVYIVGIGLNYNGDNYLKGTINDVVEFCTYYKYILDKKGVDNEVFYMLQMTNEENGNDYTKWDSPYAPSKDNIKNLLRSFREGSELHEKIDKNDLLVIYYSGHGNQGDTYDNSNNGAFCLLNRARQVDPDLYMHDEFINDLRGIESAIVVVCDSCFSGHLAGVVSNATAEIYKGSVYDDFGKNDKYDASFTSLKNVGNVFVLSAARASEYSFEGESKFNNENHGFFTGNALETMGFEHSDDVFGEVPFFDASTNGKTHSPLELTLKAKGTVPSDSKIKNMKLTLNDLYSNSKTTTVNTFVGKFSQKAVRSMGPCDIIMIW